MTSKMLLAAIQPNEQIYFITSKVDELDGVVVRDQEVVYVPFWSYINNNAGVITRLKGNEFLDTLWDGGQALKSDEWNEKFINRTNPFTESDLKPVAKLLLDVPRERKPEVEQDLSVFETKALGDVPSVRPTMRSGGKRRLRTGVRRGRLALEPYDPDARDGDNDGIVQEGTAWERPASARILDSRGTEIRRGQQASARPTGIRVVDRDGNDIDYKPTYEGGRAGTIGGSEVPRPRPSVKPPEKLTPPKKAAAKKPAKPTRESPLADHGARSLRERGLQSAREQYRAAVTPPEPEMIQTPDVSSLSPALPYTPAERIDLGAAKWRAEEVKSELSASNSQFMDNLSDEEILQIAEHLGIEVPNNVALAARGAIDEYLIEKEIEIIVGQMNETRKGDIYVAVPPDVLEKILKDRRILSQFESGTSGGLFSPETRRSFEYYNMGIPETLEDRLRPIYGFQLSEDQLGFPITSSPAAQHYGNIVIQLKKDVRGRTTMTGGDSLDNELVAIPVDGEVSESRVLSATGQSFIWNATEIAEEALMEEVFGDLNFGSGETTPPFRYNEVQVHGGVTLDMIEEVIYPSGGYYEDKIREAIIEALEEARIKHTEDW